MSNATIRDLRNNGGEVVDRVLTGESVVYTGLAVPVAELVPLSPEGLDAATLLERWPALPPMDVSSFKAALDRVLDPPR